VRKTNLWSCLALACVSSAFLSHPAQASGFGSTEISVKGLGRANSGEAADTGVDSVWWNPASIARGPREVSAGAHWRQSATVLSDRGSTVTRPIPPAGLTTPVGGASRIEDGAADVFAPTLALALPIGDRFAVGLSVLRPFHLEGDFGSDSFGRYDTIRNKIDITDVQLTGALRLTDQLDLGLGLTAQYMDASLDSAYPNLNPSAPDALSRLAGDGWDYGWTVGLQAHLDHLTLGASYRSAIDHTIAGRIELSGLQGPLAGANFAADADTNFSTPWAATLAARWPATPALTLNAQVVRWGWSEYDVITVSMPGQTALIPQEYKDTTSIAVGFDYALTPAWTVRAGVQSDPTPTPDDLREPGVADSDRLVWAVGLTRQLPQGAVHAAIAYTRFEEAAIVDEASFYAGTPAATSARIRGAYEGEAFTASVGLGWRF
jgi:long-chain fatty acid transport protein